MKTLITLKQQINWSASHSKTFSKIENFIKIINEFKTRKKQFQLTTNYDSCSKKKQLFEAISSLYTGATSCKKNWTTSCIHSPLTSKSPILNPFSSLSTPKIQKQEFCLRTLSAAVTECTKSRKFIGPICYKTHSVHFGPWMEKNNSKNQKKSIYRFFTKLEKTYLGPILITFSPKD